jgi:phenylacetate-coenzyme A ligase PaaK-like adenylate-forming protein
VRDLTIVNDLRANVPRLRRDVVLRVEDGEDCLRDLATGLRLTLSPDAARLVGEMARGGSFGASGDIAEFVTNLATLGLFEPTQPDDAARIQGLYVLQQAHELESQRVRATVERAHRATRMHAAHLNGLVTGGSAGSWSLPDLPVLTKPVLRRFFPDGLASTEVNLRELLRTGDVVLAATSGTTGERLQVYSDTRLPRLVGQVAKFWQLELDEKRPLRTAVFTSAVCAGVTCNSGRTAMTDRVVFEHTLFLPAPRDLPHMSRAEVLRVEDELRRFEPDFLFVNPFYLTVLADSAARHGISLPGVRAILVTYQFVSHCQRRALARAFDAPVFEVYAATELGGSQAAIGCPHGRLHVRLDQVFLEIVDEGRPVAPGEVGMVTVTTHNDVMPLVRYQPGDLARFRLEPCPCDVGSAWPSLWIEGRAHDAFDRGARRVTTRDVDEVLRDVPLLAYQLRETAPGCFLLAGIPERSATAWREDADGRLGALLRPDALIIEEVGEIRLDESQKFRFTCPMKRDPSESVRP